VKERELWVRRVVIQEAKVIGVGIGESGIQNKIAKLV